ncbi:transcriptional regulator, TetR family [Nocardia nova SH22a]|uniref:Transcriptional regulator, TetR family n=1 Tax=Nocardia nova SH22a TaxID=1415166 RepID=W5TKT6_9NOCA|nr:TetR/AcrR family transcriptional regulator [Nocardia nova]AHH19960.1 transcriptional regulator, TetR family [Nocardia nova SH22a]
MGMAEPTDDPPRRLPRGPHRLDPAVVAASQRVRLLDAVVDLVAERGFAPVRVADVIERAGISRKTFYEHFSNKEDCFVSALDYYTQLLDTAVVDAAVAQEAPLDRLRAGYRALLGALAARPALARVYAVAAPEAGQAARERRAAWLESSVRRLRTLYAETIPPTGNGRPELPDHVARAIVGAVDALVVHHLETRGASSLEELVPTVTDVARQLMDARIASPGD